MKSSFFSFLSIPYTVHNFLLDYPHLTVIKNFRLHLRNIKQIRYRNLQLLKVFRTVQNKVDVLFRESLRNRFLATLPRVVKMDSMESASDELIAEIN